MKTTKNICTVKIFSSTVNSMRGKKKKQFERNRSCSKGPAVLSTLAAPQESCPPSLVVQRTQLCTGEVTKHRTGVCWGRPALGKGSKEPLRTWCPRGQNDLWQPAATCIHHPPRKHGGTGTLAMAITHKHPAKTEIAVHKGQTLNGCPNSVANNTLVF